MKFPRRKIIRLANYDYSNSGVYFVTICTYNRECIFGKVINGEMCFSNYGEIAYKELINTSNKRIKNGININKFVVMPNHIHLLVIVGSRLAVTEKENRFSQPKSNSLATIIGGYKSAVTRNINRLRKADMASHVPTIWQSRYYEHVVRDPVEYQKIWEYIDTNPLQWEIDTYYTK